MLHRTRKDREAAEARVGVVLSKKDYVTAQLLLELEDQALYLAGMVRCLLSGLAFRPRTRLRKAAGRIPLRELRGALKSVGALAGRIPRK